MYMYIYIYIYMYMCIYIYTLYIYIMYMYKYMYMLYHPCEDIYLIYKHRAGGRGVYKSDMSGSRGDIMDLFPV